MLNNSSKYQVIKNIPFTYDDYVLVSKYYQPIIGPVATLVYINFLNEVINNTTSADLPISKLQVYVNTSIDKIYYALKVLDRADLVKMYKSKENDKFIFEINRPFTREEFLCSTYLTNLLLKQVGEQMFKEITSAHNNSIVNLSEYTKVDTTMEPAVKRVSEDPYLKYLKQLDFDNTIEELTQIANVCSKHKLSKIEIETILPLSKQNNEIKLAKFTKAIAVLREDVVEEEEIEEVRTKDGVLVVFDKYDSELFLSKLSGGRELSPTERNLISTLRDVYKLADPVINVLIDYVLLINDKNLNKNFVEAIAANWSRKGLKTSTQAMDFVKEYNKKRNQKQKQVEGNIVPEWLNENEKIESVPLKELDVPEEVDESFDIFSNFEGV